MSFPSAFGADLVDPPTSGASILVVDDNPSKRLALRAVLTPLEHEIVEADSGRAALRCVMAQDFAVILLDIRMPGMNGFETASVIRTRLQSELTPIIFITAYAHDELGPLERYAEGAVDFMMAPVRPEELRAKVTVFANLFLHNQALTARSRDIESMSDRWKLLVDNVPTGVFQTDETGRCVYTNKRWTEVTGIEPEDAAGRTLESLFGADLDDDSPLVGPGRRRFELHDAGVAPRLLEMTSAPFPTGSGHACGWIGTLLEVVADGAPACSHGAPERHTDVDGVLSRSPSAVAPALADVRTPMRSIIDLAEHVLAQVEMWTGDQPRSPEDTDG